MPGCEGLKPAIHRHRDQSPADRSTATLDPEEMPRTLAKAELAARDAPTIVNRLKAAGFRVTKTPRCGGCAA
jgi:hypothetical protein